MIAKFQDADGIVIDESADGAEMLLNALIASAYARLFDSEDHR
jgi:hypothetical protein